MRNNKTETRHEADRLAVARHIVRSTAAAVAALLFLMAAVPAMAWGPSSPANTIWVTNKNCVFTVDCSGLGGYEGQFQVDLDGTVDNTYTIYTWSWPPSGTISLGTERTSGNPARWRCNIYKYDYIYCGIKYGVGWSGWSSSYAYFALDYNPPSAGLKSAPGVLANGTYYVKNPVSFNWSAGSDSCSGVKQYRINIDGTVTGGPNFYSTATSKSISGLAAGLHNYNIFVQDNCFGIATHEANPSAVYETAYSTNWSFFVDDTKPPNVNMLEPHDDDAINPDAQVPGLNDLNPSPHTAGHMVNFKWDVSNAEVASSTASGVSYYSFNITRSPNSVTQNVGNVATTILGDNLPTPEGPLKNLPDGIYNWYVTATDRSGNTSNANPAFKLTIDRARPVPGTLQGPGTGTTYYTKTPIIPFAWTTATDNDKISKHEVYIWPYGGTYNPAKFYDNGINTSISLDIAKPLVSGGKFAYGQGQYQWDIKAYDRAQNYAWFAGNWDFIYDYTAPSPNIKVQPWCNPGVSMFSTKSSSIYFEWKAATDLPSTVTNSGLDRYVLNVRLNSETASPTTYTNALNLTRTVPGLPEGKHWWFVQVYDRAGNVATYSPEWSFKIDKTKPNAGYKEKPSYLPGPWNGATDVYKTNSTNVTFKWTYSTDTSTNGSESGVDHVDLEVVGSGGGTSFTQYNVISNPANETNACAGSYPKTGLTEGKYTWNIRVWDRAGNDALYDAGQSWSFIIDLHPPNAGAKTAPVRGNTPKATYSDTHVTNDNTPTFQWSDAFDYNNVSPVSELRYDLYIDGALAYANVKSPFTVPVAIPDGDHTWNILVWDKAGNSTFYDSPAGTQNYDYAKWKIKIDTQKPEAGKLYGMQERATITDELNMGTVYTYSGIDVNTGTPKFMWNEPADPAPPTGTASGIYMYRLVIEIPKGTTKFDSGYSIFGDGVPTPITYNLPTANKLADDGPYYWTIWAKDYAGNESKFAKQWNFYVDSAMAFEVTNYRLLVSRENSMWPGTPALYMPSPPYEVDIINNTNWYIPTVPQPVLGYIKPDDPVPAISKYGTTYYWTVKNQDITGLWGKYEDYAVTIVTLVPGELKSPPNNSLSKTKPKLEWTESLPPEVRRKYRVVAYKGGWGVGAPVINAATNWSEDGDKLPLFYEHTTSLVDATYFWSVYATDDMTAETKYPQTWSFIVDRKPRVTASSPDLYWYAGYSHCITVDAFGADGHEYLGTCELTLYHGATPIRKITYPISASGTPAVYDVPQPMVAPVIDVLDGDPGGKRLEVGVIHCNSGYIVTDPNYSSIKRYLFNLAPHYNFADRYPNQLTAKVRVYYFDKTKPADSTFYGDYPATGVFGVGTVVNKLEYRIPSAASSETESILLLGMTDSKRNYSIVKPGMNRPPDGTLQYREDDAEDCNYIYMNGEFYFQSGQTASSKPLSAAAARETRDALGNPLFWRITKYPNNYDAAMRSNPKIFNDPNYIPKDTYDFNKILAQFNGTTPVEVMVVAADSTKGTLSTIKNNWSEPDVTNYLDRSEDAGNENTLTKYETWIHYSGGDAIMLTYSADMCSNIFLNGEPILDAYNIYSGDETQHMPRIVVTFVPQTPFSTTPGLVNGWNHLAIYVLHQKTVSGNGLNGLCYNIINVPKVEAFKKGSDGYIRDLMRSYPVPQANQDEFANNGRGTSIVVYKQIFDALKNPSVEVAKNNSSDAIIGNHIGVFFADKSSTNRVVATKPTEGGDHKIGLGMVTNEYYDQVQNKPVFEDRAKSFTSCADPTGFINIHVNHKPYSPTGVNNIYPQPKFVCPAPYTDVEAIPIPNPTLTVNKNVNEDRDSVAESAGFHHSPYFSDYLTKYGTQPYSSRTDEVRYIYVISDTKIEDDYFAVDWAQIIHFAPVNRDSPNFYDFMPASYTVPNLDEAHNVNGVIEPVYTYKVWARDEHGELQPDGSESKRFCIDRTPPVVADIHVYYDKEGVRLDPDDETKFVVNDKTAPGTTPIALIGHTLTLWAYCTDEITADPRNFKNGQFYIRKSDALPTDPWIAIDATCEVDTAILYEDQRFVFKPTPCDSKGSPKHPNGYYWFAFYTIPYNSELTYYDVDFRITDAVGNRSNMLTDVGGDYAALTKKQFKVGTIGFNKAWVPSSLRTNVVTVNWGPFSSWREDFIPVDHYIVSFGDLTPNPFETNNWVPGDMTACTREVRVEGDLPVFVIPVEKIETVGFGTDLNDTMWGFEEPTSVTNRNDGWSQIPPYGDFYGIRAGDDIKNIKEGMYSWANYINGNTAQYVLYKDFNVGAGVEVAFGAWIKKQNKDSIVRLRALFYNNNNVEITSAPYPVETLNNIKSNAWIRFYLSSEGRPSFVTKAGVRRMRLQIEFDPLSEVYVDQIGYAAYTKATIDITPPQKPISTVGMVNNHLNTGNSASFFGYWNGQWDIKGSAWLDEPGNFPTLLAANIFDLVATNDRKKVGQASYRIDNPNTQAASVGYFQNADVKLNVENGDTLEIWINLADFTAGSRHRKVQNLGIALSDGTSWEARGYFGIDPGAVNKVLEDRGLGAGTMKYIGVLPESEIWVPLHIPISNDETPGKLNIGGRQISGIAFSIDGTYENSVAGPPEEADTVSVYVDFVDKKSGSGVLSYLPQLQIMREGADAAYSDFSTLKSQEGYRQSGYMTTPCFDDDQFKEMSIGTKEAAFTGKLAVPVFSSEGGTVYPRTTATSLLSAEQIYITPTINVSQKLKLTWPTGAGKNKFDYRGGALVIWALVKNVDYSRDSLSELNVGVDFSTIGEGKLMTIAKYRAATLTPKSRKPPEFTFLRETSWLSTEEVKATANITTPESLYKMSDSFETMLSGVLPFHRNFVDAGKLPSANGEWVPLIIPVSTIVPQGIIVSDNEYITINNVYVETANCDVYIDYIGRIEPFRVLGDWQGNMEKYKFAYDPIFSWNDLHNPEHTLDGTESVRFKSAGNGERSFYFRLNPATPANPPDVPFDFDPKDYWIYIPADDPATNTVGGGIFSLNVYIGTNEALMPTEFMVEFHEVGKPMSQFDRRAFWGYPHLPVPGATSTDIPSHYYMGPMPDVRGGWAELLIPTALLGMNGLVVDGFNVRAYTSNPGGMEFWVDRIGMLGIVPHSGEEVRHSVYAWNLDDYTFFSMRVKTWDKVLNESDYSYSKYVRSKDRTPPIIQSTMSPRINYQGLGIKEPLGGVYYKKDLGGGNSEEVPLVFKDAAGNYKKELEVDLSVTTDDYLNFETLDASRVYNNLVSVGVKQFSGGGTAEIFMTQSTARDPQPSAEYINSEWLTDIAGRGSVPEKEIQLNDTNQVWLVDPLKRYAQVRYYFKKQFNYIARQIVYDDEGNFTIGGDTYIDVTPGPVSRLIVYYPDTTVVEIGANEAATINPDLTEDIKTASRAWVGVTAKDSMDNPVLKGKQLKWSWGGYSKTPAGNIKDLNTNPLERLTIIPTKDKEFDPLRAYRTTDWSPPRPYFQIARGSDSVELAEKLLTKDQIDAVPKLEYCTQEVFISSYTGYNINGEAYEVGALKNPLNNFGLPFGSGDSEAFFVTTTHAGDVLWAIVSTEDGGVTVQTAKFRVVPAGLNELNLDPGFVEIDAESGNATFSAKGFDAFRRYNLRYHSASSFESDSFAENEMASYEYRSTNEIAVNPLWTLDTHEVAYDSATQTFDITNKETFGVFLSDSRTSTNTYGAGWKEGTFIVQIVDTAEVRNLADGSISQEALTYLGSKYLSTGAEVKYGLQPLPNGKGWDINKVIDNQSVFIHAESTVEVKPILKGYLGFRNIEDEATTKLDMNAVDLRDPQSDALKFYVQTFNNHHQMTAYDSNTEVIVRLEKSADENAKLYMWPPTNLAAGTNELTVKLANGSAEVGLVACNAKEPQTIMLFSKNPNYRDRMTPEMRSIGKVTVHPNKLDHIFFDPAMSNPNDRFAIVKDRSHPIKAYGYDCNENPVEPMEYQPNVSKWTKTAGEIKNENRSNTNLNMVYAASSINPVAGGFVPVDISVNAQANFIKYAEDPKWGACTKTGCGKTLISEAHYIKHCNSSEVRGEYVPLTGKGYIKVVNFGLFQFPCVHQELDASKLDSDGDYELSFNFMTGDDTADQRPAESWVGLAFSASDDPQLITNAEIYMLQQKQVKSAGKWSSMQLRFKLDGQAKSAQGNPGVNDLTKAKKVYLFLGAPPATGDRPALRYDTITIERVN